MTGNAVAVADIDRITLLLQKTSTIRGPRLPASRESAPLGIGTDTTPSPLTIGFVTLLALWPPVSAYRARPQRSARLRLDALALTIGFVALLTLWPPVSAYRTRPQRSAHLWLANERVHIFGASSGIRRAMDYAHLGVCVARRWADAVTAAVGNCEALTANAKNAKEKGERGRVEEGKKGTEILGVPEDFVDMVSMTALSFLRYK
jgi:hypothetical protein